MFNINSKYMKYEYRRIIYHTIIFYKIIRCGDMDIHVTYKKKKYIYYI